MATLKSLANRTVPLYIVALVILALAGVSAFAARELRNAAAGDKVVLFSEGVGHQELEFGSIPALADKNFFESVRARFVESKTSFIEADLSGMRLRYYDQGDVKLDVPILTKGREGSWWETPAGLYRAERKIENHFSAFAGVYLPWSIPFQGNFFIHGWPYYGDGSPVSSKYSGGCIRLNTDDAKKLYDLVGVGTPVLVFEKDFAPDDFKYPPGIAGIGAASYLAADLKNNFVFAERASREVVPVASITKLMTALVAVEYINIEREVTVDERAIVPTSKPRLRAGDRYTVYDLLHPLLLESSNEAAEAIARSLNRDRFIALMNQKANAIGMNQSVFVDPSGIEAGNVSTAEDLFALAKYLYNNRSFILNMSAGRASTLTYGPPAFADLENLNVFGEDPEFLGGKVGISSSAKQTILSVFETRLNGEIRPVALILLGSDHNAAEAKRLLGWLTATY